jgi:hypothetical protein
LPLEQRQKIEKKKKTLHLPYVFSAAFLEFLFFMKRVYYNRSLSLSLFYLLSFFHKWSSASQDSWKRPISLNFFATATTSVPSPLSRCVARSAIEREREREREKEKARSERVFDPVAIANAL